MNLTNNLTLSGGDDPRDNEVFMTEGMEPIVAACKNAVTYPIRAISKLTKKGSAKRSHCKDGSCAI